MSHSVKLSVNPHTLLCLPLKTMCLIFVQEVIHLLPDLEKHVHLFMTRCVNCIETNDERAGPGDGSLWESSFKKNLYLQFSQRGTQLEARNDELEEMLGIKLTSWAPCVFVTIQESYQILSLSSPPALHLSHLFSSCFQLAVSDNQSPFLHSISRPVMIMYS